ncbi:MAG: DUF998 domain-containing protein [Actinobacteria bacterium]|nr:DUF998 domain-containing protein [Actinomycetota bacterium]
MPSRSRAALVFAWTAAITPCVGTEVVGALWSEYSPWHQVVSTLAAVGAPTRAIMNVVLVVTMVALAALAVTWPGAGALGRAFLMTSATAVGFAVALPFPAPDVDTGAHTAAVTVAMVMLGFAPIAACTPWRRGQWALRWQTLVPVTSVLIVLGLTFLANWLHKTSVMGVVERVFVAAEMACLVWAVHASQRLRRTVARGDVSEESLRELSRSDLA